MQEKPKLSELAQAVWEIIGDNSALMVLVETGPCKGKVLWVRAEDVFIGGSVM